MPALSGAVELNFDFVLREKGAGNGAFLFPDVPSLGSIQLYDSTMMAMPWPPPMQAVARP